MRMHDRLMTETPQPYGGDEPMTDYAVVFADAQVIDATDVMMLFFDMERQVLIESDHLGEMRHDSEIYFAHRFASFDWSSLTMNMPPFETFVIEFDANAALDATRTDEPSPGAPDRNLGQMAVAFASLDPSQYLDHIESRYEDYNRDVHDLVADVRKDPDVKWILSMSVFSQIPAHPIMGPIVSFTVPVRADGTLMIQSEDGAPVSLMAPAKRLRGQDEMDRLIIGSKWLYMTAIPALMAINFMHTPQGEKGYHNRVPHKPAKNPNKHFQRKNFRPLTSWHVLDIGPLREQFQRTLGRQPRSASEFAKAMHIVRGNTATYAPNTYFGRKHDEPITVFRPAHRRGDLDAGKVDKDYRLRSDEAS